MLTRKEKRDAKNARHRRNELRRFLARMTGKRSNRRKRCKRLTNIEHIGFDPASGQDRSVKMLISFDGSPVIRNYIKFSEL